MFESPQNKMVGNKDFKSNARLRTKKFYFPAAQTTVVAKTLAEAQTKLKKIKK